LAAKATDQRGQAGQCRASDGGPEGVFLPAMGMRGLGSFGFGVDIKIASQ
jgi:hypothetical protein